MLVSNECVNILLVFRSHPETHQIFFSTAFIKMKLKQLWDNYGYKKKKKLLAKRCLPFLFLWLPAAAHQSCLCDMLWLHLPGSLLSFFCLNETKDCFCSQKHQYRLCSEELELKIVNHLCQNDTWIEKQRGSREQLEAKPLWIIYVFMCCCVM